MQEFASRRSPVYATKGMVASSQPAATQAGVSILAKGGNAADAAIAVAAALNVTEPCSTGLGGDAFALYFNAKDKKISALNGSGRSSRHLTLERAAEHGDGKKIKRFHPMAVTVPGACAMWCDFITKFGSLTMKEVLEPAIRLATEGFPVEPVTAYCWKMEEGKLKKNTNGAELLIDGNAPKAGQIFRNPCLAASLETICRGGAEEFYNGEIADKVAGVIQDLGGVISKEDLAAHKSSWVEPISTVYKNTRIYECPPNGQGLTVLIALNILSCFEIDSLSGPLDPDRLHLEIEALRLAFADAKRHVTDPEKYKVPLDELLDAEYAKKRAALINRTKANLEQVPGDLPGNSDTVYFCVVDGQGNACSMVNSNFMGFGTGIVAEGTGFTLQNRGFGFSLDPNHPNVAAPNKRPYHTIIPGMALREDDSLLCPFGVMGGYMQPQGHVHVLLAMLEDGLSPQAALDVPRFCIKDGEPHEKVLIEKSMPDEVVKKLGELGQPTKQSEVRYGLDFGKGQIITRDAQSGALCAGSEPRADGCAMGLY